jgi:hypothetical protein
VRPARRPLPSMKWTRNKVTACYGGRNLAPGALRKAAQRSCHLRRPFAVTTFSTVSRARHGAPGRSGSGRFVHDREALREFVRRHKVHRHELPEMGGAAGDSGAAACPRPMGGSPPAAGTAAGPLHRCRQAWRYRTATVPQPHTPAQVAGSPPVAGQSLTREDHN